MQDTGVSDRIPFLLRPYRGPEDLPGMAAARAACAARDGIDPLSTLEGIPTAEQLAEAYVLAPGPDPDFDPCRDLLVAETQGPAPEIAGYSVVEWWHEYRDVTLYLVRGWTRPDCRGLGLGAAMLRWGEARARERAATLPPGRIPMYGGNASTTEADTAALLRAEGYSVAFAVLEMERAENVPLPDAPVPPGFVVRHPAEADMRALRAALDSCYADTAFSGPITYDEWRGQQTDLSEWYVAFDAATGQVAGEVHAGPYKGYAQVYECSVVAHYRCRGLARALLAAALADLAGRGITRTRLFTVRENPHRAWAVYESAGFRTIKRFDRYRKPM